MSPHGGPSFQTSILFLLEFKDTRLHYFFFRAIGQGLIKLIFQRFDKLLLDAIYNGDLNFFGHTPHRSLTVQSFQRGSLLPCFIPLGCYILCRLSPSFLLLLLELSLHDFQSLRVLFFLRDTKNLSDCVRLLINVPSRYTPSTILALNIGLTGLQT